MTTITKKISAYEYKYLNHLMCGLTYADLPTDKEKQEMLDDLKGRSIVKIQDYMDDGPGFIGDLFFIVHGYSTAITYISHVGTTWKIIYSGDIGHDVETLKALDESLDDGS
jgi:hypothetical protein